MTLKTPYPAFLAQIEGQKILASHIARKAGNPTGDALRELYEQNVV
jgi:hypothetical protein